MCLLRTTCLMRTAATLTLWWGHSTTLHGVKLYTGSSESDYLTVDLLEGGNTFYNVTRIVLENTNPFYTRFYSSRFENLERIRSVEARVIDPSKDAYARIEVY